MKRRIWPFETRSGGKMFVLCMQNLSAVPGKPLMPDLHLGAQRENARQVLKEIIYLHLKIH